MTSGHLRVHYNEGLLITHENRSELNKFVRHVDADCTVCSHLSSKCGSAKQIPSDWPFNDESMSLTHPVSRSITVCNSWSQSFSKKKTMPKHLLSLVLIAGFLSLISFPMVEVFGQTTVKAPPSVSGLPIPRFVTLGTNQARMRRGPGVQYPVDWIYKRRGLPVEVIAEFELWRKVRDVDGAEGWMHKSLLSGRRLVRITGQKRPFRERPEINSPILFYAEGGVLGKVEKCQIQFCRVNIEKNAGMDR